MYLHELSCLCVHRSVTTTVTVTISDVSDNAPICSPSYFTASLQEDSAVDTPVSRNHFLILELLFACFCLVLGIEPGTTTPDPARPQVADRGTAPRYGG